MTKSKKLTSLAALSLIAAVTVEIDTVLGAQQDADLTEVLNTEEYLASLEPTLTDEELLQALDQAELDQTPTGQETSQATETPATEEAPATDDAPQDIDDLIADLEDDLVEEKAEHVLEAFDDRIAAERVKDPHNDSIVKSLNKSRSKLGQLGAAAVMIAA